MQGHDRGKKGLESPAFVLERGMREGGQWKKVKIFESADWDAIQESMFFFGGKQESKLWKAWQ